MKKNISLLAELYYAREEKRRVYAIGQAIGTLMDARDRDPTFKLDTSTMSEYHSRRHKAMERRLKSVERKIERKGGTHA